MTVATQKQGGGYVERSGGGGSSGLADVIELILDKGLVIDVFVRVSIVGIEILTIDARIVVASVDTFLRFAEATNRLDLYGKGKGGKDLPELVQGITEGGAKGISFRDDDEEEEEPAPRRRPRQRQRERSE